MSYAITYRAPLSIISRCSHKNQKRRQEYGGSSGKHNVRRCKLGCLDKAWGGSSLLVESSSFASLIYGTLYSWTPSRCVLRALVSSLKGYHRFLLNTEWCFDVQSSYFCGSFVSARLCTASGYALARTFRPVPTSKYSAKHPTHEYQIPSLVAMFGFSMSGIMPSCRCFS